MSCLSSFIIRSSSVSGRRCAAGGGSSISSSISNHIKQQVRHKHQVRVIVTKDLPDGQMRGVYAGEVHNVAAGYARNYLIPGKMAVYATPHNFDRCGLIDPEIAAKEEEAQQKLLDDEENEDLKAADILRRYLRNKTLKIIRNVDPNQPIMCHPGHVNAQNLRDKLSKHLKIDLEEHETIRIRNEPIVGLDSKTESELLELIEEIDAPTVVAVKKETSEEGDVESVDNKEETTEEELTTAKPIDTDCDTKVKQLGDYVAKITLAGEYVVPLKFTVQRR